jgi:hypothetical protein
LNTTIDIVKGQKKKIALFSASDFLLLDFAVEYPFFLKISPRGVPLSPIQIPTLLQLGGQVGGMLILDRIFYSFLPLYPQDQPLHDAKAEFQKHQSPLSLYNIIALEYLTPRMALSTMLFVVEYSAGAEKFLGSTHAIGLGLFLLIRTFFGCF